MFKPRIYHNKYFKGIDLEKASEGQIVERYADTVDQLHRVIEQKKKQIKELKLKLEGKDTKNGGNRFYQAPVGSNLKTIAGLPMAYGPTITVILNYLIDRMNAQNIVIASKAEIARDCNLSDDVVKKQIRNLTKRNIIITSRKGNKVVYIINSQVAWKGRRSAMQDSYFCGALSHFNKDEKGYTIKERCEVSKQERLGSEFIEQILKKINKK